MDFFGRYFKFSSGVASYLRPNDAVYRGDVASYGADRGDAAGRDVDIPRRPQSNAASIGRNGLRLVETEISTPAPVRHHLREHELLEETEALGREVARVLLEVRLELRRRRLVVPTNARRVGSADPPAPQLRGPTAAWLPPRPPAARLPRRSNTARLPRHRRDPAAGSFRADRYAAVHSPTKRFNSVACGGMPSQQHWLTWSRSNLQTCVTCCRGVMALRSSTKHA